MPQDWFSNNPAQGTDWFSSNAPSLPSIEERRTAAKQAFEAASPESHLGMNLKLTGEGGLGQNLVEGLSKLGHVLFNTAPGADTGNVPTSIPGLDTLRNAFSGAIPGGAATSGLGLKEAVSASPAVQAVKGAANWLADKVDAERIFNKVAGVPAGRQGVRVSEATGEVTQQPANAPMRALEAEGKGPLSQVKAALFQKPTPELQMKVASELNKAGDALGGKLAESSKVFDVAPDLALDNPKIQQAMQNSGIKPGYQLVAGRNPGGGIGGQTQSIPSIPVTPTQAHLLRSKIGELVPKASWGQESSPAVEQLKDAWSMLSDKISKEVPEIQPFNDRWKEAYLYGKALANKLAAVGTGGKGAVMPSTAAREALMEALKKAGYIATGVGVGGAAVYGVRKALE